MNVCLYLALGSLEDVNRALLIPQFLSVSQVSGEKQCAECPLFVPSVPEALNPYYSTWVLGAAAVHPQGACKKCRIPSFTPDLNDPNLHLPRSSGGPE